ncbi:MAG: hypothetical protein K1X57_10380 [Gemmataceae bacterium]|nr:hypothetical protein [Gemmataceae bacterium]
MKTVKNTRTITRRQEAEVRALLRDIGRVLWLSKQMAAEITRESCQPARPEMAEFCAVDSLAFTA